MFQFALTRTAKQFNHNLTSTFGSRVVPKINILVKFGVLLNCLFLFALALSAQTKHQQWIYIARSEVGRFYVKRKLDHLSDGNRAMWSKLIYNDGSERINYTEWNCEERRFRIKQSSFYAANGSAIEHLKDLAWVFVTPESAAEGLFEEACGTPREVKYAVITLKEVKLRAAPARSGVVYRTAKDSEKFLLTPFAPVGAWYQIYDPQTLVEYWVHGNGIKIISADSDEMKSNKPKKKDRSKQIEKKRK